MTDGTTPTVKHLHPIRGFFWGLLFGVGLAFVLVFATLIELSISNLAIVTFVGLALGVAWSLVGPAKPPSGPPPSPVHPPTAPPPSRFDDFGTPTEHPPPTAPSVDPAPADDPGVSGTDDAADASPEGADEGAGDRWPAPAEATAPDTSPTDPES